jgi:hypothetical protein
VQLLAQCVGLLCWPQLQKRNHRLLLLPLLQQAQLRLP